MSAPLRRGFRVFTATRLWYKDETRGPNRAGGVSVSTAFKVYISTCMANPLAFARTTDTRSSTLGQNTTSRAAACCVTGSSANREPTYATTPAAMEMGSAGNAFFANPSSRSVAMRPWMTAK